MIMIIMLAYIIALSIEIFSLVRKKYLRELVVFLVFSVAAFTLSVIYIIGINIPSPAKLMQYVVEDIFHLKYPQ